MLIGFVISQGCRCKYELNIIPFEHSLNTLQKSSYLNTFRSTVCMSLIKNNCLPFVSGCFAKECHITRSEQEVFQHRIVGYQYVGRSLTHLFTTYKLIFRRLNAFTLNELIPCASKIFSSFARELTISDSAAFITCKQFSESSYLVIDQSVHWINDQRSYSRAKRSCFLFLQKFVYNGNQKALRLTRTCSGCNYKIFLFSRFQSSFNLVAVQSSCIRIKFAEIKHTFTQNTLINQLGYSLFFFV